MTTGNFRYLDPASIQDNGPEAWTKVDSDVTSYGRIERRRSVTDIRTSELDFGIDVSGFDVYNSPPTETSFTDEAAVRTGYYAEVESLLRRKLPGVKKVVIFDHTIRRREKSAPRQPVQQVHVDQTSFAAEMRVRRHVCSHEVESLIKGRYQIINVWRPIAYPASDFPLAVIDWSTTTPDDLIKVNLLYPKQTSLADGAAQSEICPDPQSANSTEGYEVKGEQWAVKPNSRHKFYYMKNMTPNEVMFIKCFDSKSQGQGGGTEGVAGLTPHTAFFGPATPTGARGRQSIEVRCLIFYEQPAEVGGGK